MVVFSLILHSHIPYCRKSGVWPAGEEWLFEAMLETYIPLLSTLRRFQQQNQRPRITIGIVPILAEQLADPYMNSRFCEYIEDKIRRAEQDQMRFSTDIARRTVAEYYRNLFNQVYDAYKNHFFRNILGTLKWLQEENVVELITSGATHGFLPLLERDSAVFSQIHLGVKTYEKYFGRKPRGIWLPECAYRPRKLGSNGQIERRGIDDWLADEGIKYFFVEDVGITGAEFIENKQGEPHPTTYRGYQLESGVCVFGRNTRTGKQVWSPHEGYPGHPSYREFHQKDPQTGLNYWKITGKPEKEIYIPSDAKQTVGTQAYHFMSLIKELGNEQKQNISDIEPIIVSPYDCELYGHWWHEGVDWIEQVYQQLLSFSSITLLSPEEYIQQYHDTFSTIRMKPSTWGLNSDFTVWQNPEHGWIWPYINESCRTVENIIQNIQQEQRHLTDRESRILKQLCRELLLLEGSDWPFLLYTEQAKEYANQRFHHHHQRLNKLVWAAKNLNESFRINDYDLQSFEFIDNPWEDIDFTLFKSR